MAIMVGRAGERAVGRGYNGWQILAVRRLYAVK